MKIKVEVTQYEIDEGAEMGLVVDFAMNRIPLADGYTWDVAENAIGILNRKKKEVGLFDIPKALERYIRDGDLKKPLKPRVFTINVPDELTHLLRTDAAQSDSQRVDGE